MLNAKFREFIFKALRLLIERKPLKLDYHHSVIRKINYACDYLFHLEIITKKKAEKKRIETIRILNSKLSYKYTKCSQMKQFVKAKFHLKQLNLMRS